MGNVLHCIFQKIAKATNEQELQQAVMNMLGEYFDVQSWGLYLLDNHSAQDINVKSIPEVCLKGNPVGRYVVERHAPAHEELLLSSGDWSKLCTRDDHAHVMSGPIINDGRLVGILNFTRCRGTSAFDAHNLADLSALCLHISAKLAAIRAQTSKSLYILPHPLTERELEIADLVAKGLTNAEVGERLWITQNSVKQALKRIFRKLEVSSRTEMVTKLFSEAQ